MQLNPKRVPVNGNYLLRVLARDDADIAYADTSLLALAIDMVHLYKPSDYKDFSGVDAAKAGGQALLEEHPTIDRQADVDAAAQAIFDAIAALEWVEGIQENPIPYKHLMKVTEGLYYSYQCDVYLCLQSASSSVMVPGTAPRYWQKV